MAYLLTEDGGKILLENDDGALLLDFILAPIGGGVKLQDDIVISGSGSGSGQGPILTLTLEITDIEINLETIDEFCRLLEECCLTSPGGFFPPPGSGSGSSGGEDCAHDWTWNSDTGSSCNIPFPGTATIVPRSYLIQFVEWVNGLPPYLSAPYIPIAQLAQCCLSNPANTDDLGLRACMVSTGCGTYPPNPSYYSYILGRYNQYLIEQYFNEVAQCLGLPNLSNEPVIGDLHKALIEFEGNIIGKRCVVIRSDDPCNICFN